jgi:hypothetical protein
MNPKNFFVNKIETSTCSNKPFLYSEHLICILFWDEVKKIRTSEIYENIKFMLDWKFFEK